MFALIFDFIRFAIQFATVSAVFGLILFTGRSIGKAMNRPMKDLVSLCLCLPTPLTPVSTIKWATKVLFILIPAVILKLSCALLTKGIEKLVTFLDKSWEANNA